MADDMTTPEENTPQAVPPNPPKQEPYDPSKDPNSETAIATLQKEREMRKELERKMKAFEGIDPQAYKKAMEIAEKQAKWEEQQAQIQADIEARIQQQYEPQLDAARKQLAETQQKFVNYQRDKSLESAFYDAGGFPGEFEPAALAMRNRVRVEDDGSLVVLEADGKTPAFVADKGTSRPKNIKELIADLQGEHIWFARHFKSSEKPGFGQGQFTSGLTPDADPNQIADALTRYRNQKVGR